MFLFLIASVAVAIALIIGAVIETKHQLRKHEDRKRRKANKQADQQMYERWLDIRDSHVSNPTVQNNIKHYSAQNKL